MEAGAGLDDCPLGDLPRVSESSHPMGPLAIGSWLVGTQPPPFVATNAELITLLAGVVQGTHAPPPLSTKWLSKAAAVQLYSLVYSKDSRSATLRANYVAGLRGQARRLAVIIASLGLGRIVADSPPVASYKLEVMLARAAKELQALLKHRKANVTREAAINGILLVWDKEELDFDVATLDAAGAPPAPPDPGPSATSIAADNGPALPCSSALTMECKDFRTRQLQYCVRVLALRGKMQRHRVPWRRSMIMHAYLLEEPSLDLWRIIDAYVIRAEMTWRQSREATFQIQLVASRQEVDALVHARDAADVSARESMPTAVRARAQTESARNQLQRAQEMHRDQLLAAKTASDKGARTTRAQHAQQLAELRGEARTTNIRCQARITEVESQMTDLDNTIKRVKRQHGIRDGQAADVRATPLPTPPPHPCPPRGVT